MKNTRKTTIKTLALAMAFIGLSTPAFAAQAKLNLQEELQNEKTAQAMYQELQEKFPSTELYAHLFKAESNHISALERLMNNTEESKNVVAEKLELPDTELDALNMAIEFEEKDSQALEEELKNTNDERTKRVLGNLNVASQRHEKLLVAAKESLEKNGNLENFDLRQACGQEGRQGKENRGNGQGFGRQEARNNSSCDGTGQMQGRGRGENQKNKQGLRDGSGQGQQQGQGKRLEK